MLKKQVRAIREILKPRRSTFDYPGDVGDLPYDFLMRRYTDAAGPGEVIERWRALGETSLLESYFDPEFYLARYPNVAAKGFDPFEHYLRHGREEGWCASAAAERFAAANVLASGLVRLPASINSRKSEIEYGVELLRGEQWSSTVGVDGHFVNAYYPKSRLGFFTDIELIADLHARRSPLFASPELGAWQRDVEVSGLFDAEWYAQAYLEDDPSFSSEIDPLIYYLTEGWRRLKSPQAFSDRFYLEQYPDIAAAKAQPLVHYLRHGRSEGRQMLGEAVATSRFEAAPRLDRAVVVLIMHDCSQTGAPLLALDLARNLSRSHDVIGIALAGGDLEEDFRACCTDFNLCSNDDHILNLVSGLIARRNHDLDILVNTFACRDIVAKIQALGYPITLLVHDFADYVFPRSLVPRAMIAADRVIFPAECVRQSAAHVSDAMAVTLNRNNSRLIHQNPPQYPVVDEIDDALAALLRASEAVHEAGGRVVLGGGTIQIRKGVDLFIDAGRILRAADAATACIWLGTGLELEGASEYASFLRAQLRLAGLSAEDVFLGHTQNFRAALQCADIFLMTSLLDPFPNVAIDAAVEGLPVICFRQGTGIVELERALPLSIFPVYYRHTRGMAAKARELDLSPEAREQRKSAALAYFEGRSYVDLIGAQIEEARAARAGARESPASVDFDHILNSIVPKLLASTLGSADNPREVLSSLAKFNSQTRYPLGANASAGKPVHKLDEADRHLHIFNSPRLGVKRRLPDDVNIDFGINLMINDAKAGDALERDLRDQGFTAKVFSPDAECEDAMGLTQAAVLDALNESLTRDRNALTFFCSSTDVSLAELISDMLLMIQASCDLESVADPTALMMLTDATGKLGDLSRERNSRNRLFIEGIGVKSVCALRGTRDSDQSLLAMVVPELFNAATQTTEWVWSARVYTELLDRGMLLSVFERQRFPMSIRRQRPVL